MKTVIRLHELPTLMIFCFNSASVVSSKHTKGGRGGAPIFSFSPARAWAPGAGGSWTIPNSATIA
jgi:hypothetical protein